MDGITVHIGWEYFVGILSALIAVAWYSNGRFTALETSIEWIKDAVLDLKWSVDHGNERANTSSRASKKQADVRETTGAGSTITTRQARPVKK